MTQHLERLVHTDPLTAIPRFIPLVRDADMWQKVYHDEPAADNTLPGGTLQTYSKRGWCKCMIDALRLVHHVAQCHAPSFSLR